MKMPSLGLNAAAGFARFFLFPLGHNVEVCAHVEKAFEQQRKGMRGGFFQREDFDVVVVQAQMPSVTFEMRFREVVVEEGVVLQLGGIEFERIEVESSFENDECFVFRKNAGGD